MNLNNFYYNIKPIIPRPLQLVIRRKIANYKREKFRNIWPIDTDTGNPPANWKGWPDGKKFALVLSHDVDTQRGHDAIPFLLKIEKTLGLKSAFNIVPERYRVSLEIIKFIQRQGFEVNVHGLKHDGKLFKSYKIFQNRSKKINQYLRQWNSRGFTAPSMICNMDWLHELDIDYSTSTFDTDPFEPQPSPSKTIFPFIVNHPNGKSSHVELPYTLPQDHSLFIILGEKNTSIWERKLKWIVDKGGMALLNTHPDYMRFQDKDKNLETYPKEFYINFMNFILEQYKGQYWNAPHSEIAAYWQNSFVAQNAQTKTENYLNQNIG
ncbi:MAG: hypothetical protein KQI78_06865 [Deltaproteobacteria bacterium]|nr:hypothetical protein [Deltaproteobacteria bacterium]